MDHDVRRQWFHIRYPVIYTVTLIYFFTSFVHSIGEFIDLEEEIDPLDIEQPFCEAKFSASVSMFDHLPSIADKDKLIYSPENVLKDVSTIIYLRLSSDSVMKSA